MSGWSGACDIALVRSLKNAVSRRYGFYWTMGHFFREFPWHEDLWKTGDHVVARYHRRLDQEGPEFPLVRWGRVSLEEFMAAKESIDQQAQEVSRR